MHITRTIIAPVDLAQQNCSRAWSLLRTLAGQFSDNTNEFEGIGLDALEMIYTAMDLIAETSEAAGKILPSTAHKPSEAK